MFCIRSTRNNFFQTLDKKTPGQNICFIYFSLKEEKQREKKDFHENVAGFFLDMQNKTKQNMEEVFLVKALRQPPCS